MHWLKCMFHLFVLIILSRVSWAGIEEPAETCCLRIPPPMNIAKFDAKVADGEDWAEILYQECPFSALEAEVTQFRAKYSFAGGVLNRTRNFRFNGSCTGIRDSLFNQVGTRKAAFESTNSDNVTREDRYFSRYVDDYLIWVVCRDVNTLSSGRRLCRGPYFVSVLIRNDPPTNFPWNKLMWELRKFIKDFRKFIFPYLGEPCPVE